MMKTKQKTYRYRIKIIIKDNNIRHMIISRIRFHRYALEIHLLVL